MKQLFLTLTAVFAAFGLCAAPVITPATVDEALSKLTLEQKARLLVGVGGCNSDISHYTPGAAGWTYEIAELGIPSINLADGPVGIRINPLPWQESVVTYDENGLPVASTFVADAAQGNADPAYCTAFPSTTALAATWNRDMARLQGEIMGDEARAYGVDVILSPGVNIMRNPLCGRNFEYYSEDPLLTGALASELIKGIQSRGIGTSLKHFIANNQQTGKKVNDARMTRRALREIYAKPFEIVVRDAKPWTVMGSYNKIAGEFTQTNQELMKTLLRDEWGFDGLALTDWTVWRPAEGLLNARCPLIMPGNEDRVQEIISAVRDGKVSEQTLDDCVRDLLGLVAKSISANGWQKSMPDLVAGAEASRTLADESMVLLKNDNNVLPLSEGSKIALFGATAYKSIAGGTGSSNVNKAHIVDIDRGLAEAGYRINQSLAEVYRHYIAAQEAVLDNADCPAWQKISYHRTVIPEMNITDATALLKSQAADNEAAVVVIGRKSGETSDRALDGDYNLTPAEVGMIRCVCSAFHAVGKPVIVVLNVCGAMEISSWSELPDAILMAWFPGQECGYAVADIISGRANPSGRLPMTLPRAYDHNPSSRNYPNLGQEGGRNFDYTEYQEDIWVGYRYFDACGLEVAYPFAYGLSYTDFDYSDLSVRRRGDSSEISVTVTNSGTRPGKEVVTLFVSAPSDTSMLKPVAELRGFEKSRLLAPGESQRITLKISDDELASFDEAASAWVTTPGVYKVHVGGHPGNYRAEADFKINKRRTRRVNDILAPVSPVTTINPFEEHKQKYTWHDASQFEILGRVYPDSLPIYSRIPAFRKDITRYELYVLGQHSAGISVRFRTDSPDIILKWNTVLNNHMTHMADLGTRGLDLYVLTDEGRWRYIGPGRPMGNPTYWTASANMEPKMREYMIHLSLYDQVDKLEIGIDEGYTIENPVADTPKRKNPVVIYGTSIAHGATASRPGMAASNILQRELDREFINLGFSANGHLDYEIAEMMADVDAAAYIMDNIPNSTVTEIYEKTEPFVKILRDRHPDVPIIFIEDPKFPGIPINQKTTQSVESKNRAIREVYNRLVDAGMTNTYYVEQIYLQPEDGDATSDEYHYTDIGFRKYCDSLLPILREILDK